MTSPVRDTHWEMFRALGALAEAPTGSVAVAMGLKAPLDRSDHTEVFGFHALPHASAYLGRDGMLGGEVAARVGGFWQALGYPPPESPDHLASLFGLYAGLGERETTDPDPAHRAMLTQARTALLWEHVLPWTGVFVEVVRHARIAPWDRWADLTEEALVEEWTRLGESPAGMPRHLQDCPPPLDETFEVAHLVAPARTGMVLTRRDLVRAARTFGLGIRLTGRIPTLEALLGQSPGEIIAWLADHARRWEHRHRERPGPTQINAYWADRAANTRTVLGAILAET
jgi:hypothetical protein